MLSTINEHISCLLTVLGQPTYHALTALQQPAPSALATADGQVAGTLLDHQLPRSTHLDTVLVLVHPFLSTP